MMYLKFRNYAEFQLIFGLRECGNGNKQRMNKILLGCLKNRDFFHYCASEDRLKEIFSMSNMADFKYWLLTKLSSSSCLSTTGYYCKFPFNGEWYSFHLADLEVDNGGVCMDGDYRAVRYINHANNDRVFKMKAGKFFNRIMESCEFGRHLPQQAKSWLGEEFLTSWQSYAMRHAPAKNYEFHYGNDVEDFEYIYSSNHRRGDFVSCMTDEDNHTMYAYAVKAHAAWLTDENGEMYARCIIWDEVHDQNTGEILRLAERQYSDGVQDCLKKQLVDELISRGLIDGYKQIGAGCHDNRAFVRNNGESLADHRLYIDCELDVDDPVSYMDSFVYYNIDERKAFNYSSASYSHELDTTCGYLEDKRVYSDYHGEYISENESVYVDSRDDYFYRDEIVYDLHDNAQFEEDCVRCDHCGYYILEEDAVTVAGLEGLYFCDLDCAQRYADRNGFTWADYSERYVLDEDAVTVNRCYGSAEYGNLSWCAVTMSKDDFEWNEDDMHWLDGKWYWLEDSDAEEAYKSLTLPAVIPA